MLEIKQLRLPVCNPEAADTLPKIQLKIEKKLGIKAGEIKDLRITRHSIDGRKKPELFSVFSAAFRLSEKTEKKLLARKTENLSIYQPANYRFPESGSFSESLLAKKHRPIIIGFGPAGIFAGLYLARLGLRPLILERGRNAEERTTDVERFWKTGRLDPSSNVQFGEGGAGTFSDGKLNTVVNDPTGRNAAVLRTLVEFGAPAAIQYESMPHVGTDILKKVIVSIREEIIRLGGEIRFRSQVTGFCVNEEQVLTGVIVNGQDEIPVSNCIFAPGHSARDTFEEIYRLGIPVTAKDFAIGFRVSHPQTLIDKCQYGEGAAQLRAKGKVPAAIYKLTAKAASGRGVYSFCMCPGGHVVNASSEEGRLVVNGMSYSGRDSAYANAAIVMTIGPSVYGEEHPLDGMYFQRELEEKCFRLAEGKIPVERYQSFCGKEEDEQPLPELCIKGAYEKAPLHTLLPDTLNRDFVEGMEAFDRKIHGYAGENAYVIGLESRTSSPIRITRDETYQSVGVRGLFPCGEGAGYAGGITSAAIDGLKVAEAVASHYML